MKAIRARVSGTRVRYMKEGFDLDLTYITPSLIAMGYPATGMEKTYRNDINEVSAFLNSHHAGAYRVYNLSERKYDYTKFENRVSECGFPDHHPPPLQLLLDIMNDMLQWTARGDENVVVVHCLAGKGRTGVVCSCFLLLTGFYGNIYAVSSDRALRQMANEAIRDFWNARGQGVRYPSQALYIYYFLRVMRRMRKAPREIPRLRPAKKLLLKSVVLNGIPDYEAPPRGGCTPFLQILPAPSQHDKPALLYNSSWQNPNFETYAADPHGSIVFEADCVIQGDVLIRCFHANSFSMLGRHVVQMFHVTFNTDFFRKNCDLLRLRKKEVDEAHDNPRFPASFCLDCHVEPVIEEDECEYAYDDDEDAQVLNTARINQLDEELQAYSGPPSDGMRGSVGRRSNLSSNGSAPPRPSLQRESSLQPKPTATMMGWLYKQGGFVKSWKKRWFVARDGQLTYFQSASDPTPLGVVDLHGVVVDTAFAEETTARNKYLNYFKVVPPRKEDRTWFFGADSEGDMAKWIRVLSAQSCHGMEMPSLPPPVPITSPVGRPNGLARPSLPRRRASASNRFSDLTYPHGHQRSSTFNDHHAQRNSDSQIMGVKRGGNAASSMIDFAASTASNMAVRGSFGGGHAAIARSPPQKMKTDQVARVNTNGSDAFFVRTLDSSRRSAEFRGPPPTAEEDGDEDDEDYFADNFLVSAAVPSFAKSQPVGRGLMLSDRDRQTVLEEVTDDFRIGVYIYTADELQTAAKMQQYVETTTMASSSHKARIPIAQCVREALQRRNVDFAEQVMAEVVLLKFPTLVDAMECNPTMFMETICCGGAIDASAPGFASATAVPPTRESLTASRRSSQSHLYETEF